MRHVKGIFWSISNIHLRSILTTIYWNKDERFRVNLNKYIRLFKQEFFLSLAGSELECLEENRDCELLEDVGLSRKQVAPNKSTEGFVRFVGNKLTFILKTLY